MTSLENFLHLSVKCSLFLMVAISLGWSLSIFVSHHIFPSYESCVGITANRALNNFKYSDVLPHCTTVKVQKRNVRKQENAENQTFFSKNSDFWQILTSKNQMFQLGHKAKLFWLLRVINVFYIKRSSLAKSWNFGCCLGMGRKRSVRKQNYFRFRTLTVLAFKRAILFFSDSVE